VQALCDMLGFSPEKGTAANLAYGKALMRESDHGSVLHIAGV
jgi:hypothetical protein